MSIIVWGEGMSECVTQPGHPHTYTPTPTHSCAHRHSQGVNKRARHTECDVYVVSAVAVTGCAGMCGGRCVCVGVSAGGCHTSM